MPSVEQLQWFALVLFIIVVLVFAIIVLVMVLKATGSDLAATKDRGLSIVGRPNPTRRREAQYAAAFERYADLGQGLVAIVEKDGEERDKIARKWFSVVCEGLSMALSTGSTETFRVAIWLDEEETTTLIAIGSHLLTPKADRRLVRDTSLAGKAVLTKHEQYEPDVNKSDDFDRHGDERKPYSSVFAVPIGGADAWGAITVDAKSSGGFTDLDFDLVRRFAQLADLGALAWIEPRRRAR